MKVIASNLVRWAGLSALIAGLCYVVVGLFHPPNVIASVTTPAWAIVHLAALAMCCFGLLGLTGLYVRQADKAGWLGLAGFLLLSLWFAIVLGFTFVETFILPRLAPVLPAFADSFLGAFSGTAGEINLGVLPTLWTITGLIYILGGVLFGIATFRAGILPRGAAVLLAVGTLLAPAAAALPPELQPKIAIPVGLALAWLGYTLFVERREKAAPAPLAHTTAKLQPSQVA